MFPTVTEFVAREAIVALRNAGRGNCAAKSGGAVGARRANSVYWVGSLSGPAVFDFGWERERLANCWIYDPDGGRLGQERPARTGHPRSQEGTPPEVPAGLYRRADQFDLVDALKSEPAWPNAATKMSSPAADGFEADCRTPEQMRLANAYCRYLELAQQRTLWSLGESSVSGPFKDAA